MYIARKFENTGVCVEDLISIGTIGLIKAVNTFDAEKRIKLATYASRCIENEILMYLRRSCKLKLEVSLDEPLNVDWDGNELLLSDILGTDADAIYRGIEDEVDKELLSLAMKKLTPREKKIMELRFGLYGNREYTQKQVADMMGISQSYISRLEAHNQVAEVRDATDDVRRKSAVSRSSVKKVAERHFFELFHPVLAPMARSAPNAKNKTSGFSSFDAHVVRAGLTWAAAPYQPRGFLTD